MTSSYDKYLEKQDELELEGKKNAQLVFDKIFGGIISVLEKELEE